MKLGLALDFLILRAHSGKLVLRLKVHPKVGTRAEGRSKLYGSLWSNRLLRGDDLVDQSNRAADDLGKLRLRPVPGLELLLQELTRGKDFCVAAHRRRSSGNR